MVRSDAENFDSSCSYEEKQDEHEHEDEGHEEDEHEEDEDEEQVDEEEEEDEEDEDSSDEPEDIWLEDSSDDERPLSDDLSPMSGTSPGIYYFYVFARQNGFLDSPSALYSRLSSQFVTAEAAAAAATAAARRLGSSKTVPNRSW